MFVHARAKPLELIERGDVVAYTHRKVERTGEVENIADDILYVSFVGGQTLRIQRSKAYLIEKKGEPMRVHCINARCDSYREGYVITPHSEECKAQQADESSEIRALPSAVKHDVVKRGSSWRHTNGTVYRVLMQTNCYSTTDRYPVTVVYQDKAGRVWSRPREGWDLSFTQLGSTGKVK
jgi:hypothetical protein